MLFKAKPFLGEEKSPLLVQPAKTETDGRVQNCDRARSGQPCCYTENLSLCVQEQSM